MIGEYSSWTAFIVVVLSIDDDRLSILASELQRVVAS
jgi:hypothetical protein